MFVPATGASAAQCQAGKPSYATDAPPDCDCYEGSAHGTRVFAWIANVIVTSDAKHVLDGDATLSCDATHVIVRTHRDGVAHVFPRSATILLVYNHGGVFAQFAGMTLDPDNARRLRDGSVTLLKVL
jgi:hypothetical protein